MTGHIAMYTMATRSTTPGPKKPPRCTDFQLYAGSSGAVIDFTERRLIRCAEAATDPQQKLLLMALVVDYRARRVAVAWRGGIPVPLRVTQDA